MLAESYKILSKTIMDEGNGVWAWYIRNQAAPLIISKNERAGRIISNPPWVNNNDISDKDRKAKMLNLGKSLEVYVGGSRSTSFDIASVFVLRTADLYLKQGSISGWVLPQAAVVGKSQWARLREKIGTHLQYDLGILPFPNNAESSAIIVGRGGGGAELPSKREKA